MSAFLSRAPDQTASFSVLQEASPASDPRLWSSSQLAERGLWGRLHTDVQRRILQSRALSLPDLARLAPLGTVFREVYHELLKHDPAWLTEVAHSVFGKHLLDTLLGTFHTKPSPDTPSVLTLDLTAGDGFPEKPTLEGACFIEVNTLACGLPAPGHSSKVTWRVIRLTSKHELRVEVSGMCWLRIQMLRHWRLGTTSSSWEATLTAVPGQAAPLLAVLHLACKWAPESDGQVAESSSAALPVPPGRGMNLSMQSCSRLSMSTGLSIARDGRCSMTPVTQVRRWNDAGPAAHEDDQRALSALHMWNWRFAHDRPVDLHWRVC
eukprot:jgi/Botrbrau1/3475/Bobra.341_2s0007.1